MPNESFLCYPYGFNPHYSAYVPWLLAALPINPRNMKSYVNAQNQMGAQLNKKHKRYLCAMPPLPIPNDSF